MDKTINVKKINTEEILLLMLIVSSSMMIIKYSIFTLFFLVMLIILGCIYLKKKQIFLTRDCWVNYIFIELCISTVCTLFSNIWTSYKKCAIIVTFLYIPIYFIYAYFEKELCANTRMFVYVRKAIKCACMIELIWCFMQFLLYHGAGIDINNVLFADTFHFVDVASCFKDGKFLPSGFCWHAAYMAPVVVYSYLFFDSPAVKLLAIADAVLCGNSTALIGVSACVCLDMAFRLMRIIRAKRINIKKIVFWCFFIALIIMIYVLIKYQIVKYVWDKVWFTILRATGGVEDASADAHIRYYTSYFKVLDFSSILQIIFGFGFGCSGYPFSVIFDQYTYMKSWVTETDIMNILLSRGILGFIGYYGFLFYIALKGLKLDYRYLVLIMSIIVCGITYNIQFDWVFLFELFLYLSVRCNINIFQNVKGINYHECKNDYNYSDI